MKDLKNVICITDRHLCRRPFPDQIRIVAAQHPKAIILREKDVMEETYETLAERILPVCKEYDVPLILHTHWKTALALEVPAVKVSLQTLRDLPAKTRAKFKTLGTTVHSVEEAEEAVALGATFLTASLAAGGAEKYGTGNRLLDFLEEVAGAVDVPVYAMGGASREDMDACISRGAAGICMMSRLMTMDNGE